MSVTQITAFSCIYGSYGPQTLLIRLAFVLPAWRVHISTGELHRRATTIWDEVTDTRTP